MIKREEEAWKVFHAQRVSMPVRIQEREMPFFSSYLLTRMNELEKGILERVKDYSFLAMILR